MTIIKKSLLLLLALCGLLMIVAPKAAVAVEIRVTRSDPACVQPDCYTSIQQAIEYVDGIVNGPTGTTTPYSVRVEAGTYTDQIELKPNILVQGRETTKTMLFGTGSNAAVLVNSGVTGASIANFTITNAALGIDVRNNAEVVITNNIFIFNRGLPGTAVRTDTPLRADVVNNTFYQNDVAISGNSDILITNNIFSNNNIALQNSISPFTRVTHNSFFVNGIDGPFDSSPTNTTLDPQFVDTLHNDFHLEATPILSPCINTGNTSYPNIFDTATSDMGAYGGIRADMIPFQVSGVQAVSQSTTISVSWGSNNSYLTKGYRVHYGTSKGLYNGTGAAEGPSPILVATGTATTLSSLPVATIAPPSPVLNRPAILNQSLDLSWSSVPEATSYRVYYGTSSPPSIPIDVGPITSYTLTGLVNGQTYYVAVSAIAQNTFFIAVTALDTLNITPGSLEPGKKHESAFSEVSPNGVPIGTSFESNLSNEQSSIPETLIPYPNLPNGDQGCFIATAAYGKYSSPEVAVLREFRDQYLLTSAAGSAFVRWYYQHSPAAAAFLNTHPQYKPLVRAALTPAVGAALFMTQTSLVLRIILLMITGCFFAFLFYRKKISRTGGDR